MALSRTSYREKAIDLERHHQWINMVSCKPGIGSPYAAMHDDGVFITAIIENFEEQSQVVQFINHVCLNVRDSWLTQRLRASPMEAGIQLHSAYGQTKAFFVEGVRNACEYGALLAADNYVFDTPSEEEGEGFFHACQIRYTINAPFGETKARTVQFAAGSNVPLRLFIELLQELSTEASRRSILKDLGQIAIVDTQGLPDCVEDHLLWCHMLSHSPCF